jgi:hypothetical protein
VWVYYAAQILFFGAELTQVYASRHGSRAAAGAGAVADAKRARSARREDSGPGNEPVRGPFDPASVKPVFERSPGQSALLAAALLWLGRLKGPRS